MYLEIEGVTPSLACWTKCNSNRASRGNPSISACARVSRSTTGFFLGGFAKHIESLFLPACGALGGHEGY